MKYKDSKFFKLKDNNGIDYDAYNFATHASLVLGRLSVEDGANAFFEFVAIHKELVKTETLNEVRKHLESIEMK